MVPAGAQLMVEILKFMTEAGMAEEDPVLTGNVVKEFLAILMQKMGYTAEEFTGGTQETSSTSEQDISAPADPMAAVAPQPAAPAGARGLVGV
jgi:hypothetical protein